MDSATEIEEINDINYIETKSLDIHQLLALSHICDGVNICLTGPGGTGKTHLINLIRQLTITSGKKCNVTAMTGCASLIIKGITLHSWAGILINKDNQYELEANIKHIKKKKKYINWVTTDILIIDECSMLDVNTFELLDNIGKKLRKNDKPFGGIQIILSGDFYQIKPVENDMCIVSSKWNIIIDKVIVLKKIFRQQDKEFSKLLREVRKGELSENSKNILNSRVVEYRGNLKPTLLMSTNKEVDIINTNEHNKIKNTDSKIYKLITKKPDKKSLLEQDIFKYNLDIVIDNFIKYKNINEKFEIKINDHVMCTKNINNDVVNGSCGIVINFVDGYPLVRYNNNVEMLMEPQEIPHNVIKGLVFKYIPLKYSWAITIHKCQGMTLDLCIIDIGNDIFEEGQSYVALSRMRSLDGLFIKKLDINKINTSDVAKRFYKKYKSKYYKKCDKKRVKGELKNKIKIWEDKSYKKNLDSIKNVVNNVEEIKEAIAPINKTIYDKLNTYRDNKAIELEKKKWTIYTNKVRDTISSIIPKNKKDLKRIKGVGNKFMENYSEDILKIINETI